MPTNLRALHRIRIIDRCLSDYERIYDRRKLCEAIYDELSRSIEGYVMPSLETISGDIKAMKSGELGYIAPILYTRREGYRYTNRDFSIHNVPLQADQLQHFMEVLYVLQSFFEENRLFDIKKILFELKDKLNLTLEQEFEKIIFLELSTNSRGQKHIDDIYHYIKSKQCIGVSYQPFEGEQEWITLCPYFIKEFNNRWYVVGYDFKRAHLVNLSLDRILDLRASIKGYEAGHRPDPEQMYQNVFGMTVMENQRVYCIRFKSTPLQAKYIESKPIHKTQRCVESTDEYSIFEMDLMINYEIVHKLLSYGDGIEVLEPAGLRQEMADILKKMLNSYSTP